MKHEERTSHQAAKGCKVVPMQLVAKVKSRKDTEHRQRDHLLNHLELIRTEGLRPDPIGRHLEDVFKEGDPPACQDHDPERLVLEFQVAKILGNCAIHWCIMALRTKGKMSSKGFSLIVLSDFQPLEQGLKACGA